MFSCKSLLEVRAAARRAGAELPLSERVEVLRAPLAIGGRTAANRILIQPMEGCDSLEDGTPGDLTRRRYERFARSGAGVIWFEACAVRREARANPRQAWLRAENLDAYRRLADDMRETALKTNGFAPLILLQATHSGRYSKPDGTPAPIIACNNPLFEKDGALPAACIISDDELARVEDDIAHTAQLAQRAGFDGVDVKACHRYLASELLSAHTRPGRYGGDFENRARFLLNAAGKARAATQGDFLIASRLNVYDGFPYPYGFGVSSDGSLTPEMSEPIRLVGQLKQRGAALVNITIGNPYVNPHVNRPADVQPYTLTEDPLLGVARMLRCVGEVKAAHPDVCIAASALSYLRQFSGNLAAGAVETGLCDLAGFGRLAFAYPDFARGLLARGALAADKCCVTCGKCSQLMRLGGTAGCTVRDPQYTKLYKELTHR